MDFAEIVEGGARLRVPAGGKERGPGARHEGVFFNPAMAISRDVSVALYGALLPEGARVLDGLAASGARAVRLARSTRLRVAANDWDPRAERLVRDNARLNGVEVEVHRRNFPALLWETMWDAVDVDPFGSPSPFVDAATRAVRKGGILALTATDTTALYGVYPGVCERRYLAAPMRCEFGHELALRILAGFAARQAAKHDVALAPVLAHATDHFYRVYLRAGRGAGRADAALAEVGVAWLCARCSARGLARIPPPACPECDGGLRAAGPLWAGPLFDPEAVARTRENAAKIEAARPQDLARLLDLLAAEAEAPPLYVDVHRAAGRAGSDAPRMEALAAALALRGYRAARTHMRDNAVRTDAPEGELRKALRDASSSRG